MGDLSKDFSRSEFRCKCGCNIDKVSPTFIHKLQWARELAGIPFVINSGCRCPNYNKTVGGKPTSDHITDEARSCEGVDIRCSNGSARFKIINAALDAGFTRIGIADTFIHLGDRRSNPQNVLWTY